MIAPTIRSIDLRNCYYCVLLANEQFGDEPTAISKQGFLPALQDPDKTCKSESR